MRIVIWRLVLALVAPVAVMPWGRAEDIGPLIQSMPADGCDSADEDWEQAGLCGVQSPAAAARRSFLEYPVTQCDGEEAATLDAGSPALDHDHVGCDEPGDGCCGGLGDDHPSRRFYISGILGASFGTLQSGGLNSQGSFLNTGRATDSLLTAGAAAGVAIDRASGLLRLEVEGRGRDALSGLTNSFAPPVPDYFYSVRAVDGWSVMANAWRDWHLTERLGFYGGGGIGAGGYRLTVDDGVVSGYGHMGGFAWQAGTGTTYRLTDRTTIDLGYRFFDTVSDALPLTLNGSGGMPAGGYVSNFYASELLLSVRIYEPFRNRPVR